MRVRNKLLIMPHKLPSIEDQEDDLDLEEDWDEYEEWEYEEEDDDYDDE